MSKTKAVNKQQLELFNKAMLTDLSEYPSAISNAKGEFIFLNKAWEALLGYRVESLLNKPLLSKVYSEDLNKTKKIFQGKRKTSSFINRFIHKKGSLISIEWSVSKKGSYYYSIGRDVTEQLKREYLESEMQKMGQIGWWVFDIRTGKVAWSDEVYRIHGLKPDTNLQNVSKAIKFYPGQAEKDISNAIKNSIKNGTSYDIELPFVSADKKNKWVHTTGYPLFNKTGKVIQLFGVFRDITSLKDKRDKLRFYFSKMIESSQLATLGEISAGIAHEINNPLAIIQGNAERILLQLEREKVSFENLKINAEKVIQTTMRISDIVSSLKKLGRADKEPLEDFRLNVLVAQAINMISLKLKSERIEFKVTYLPKDITVRCRPIQIEQAILNLISNSIDAIRSMKKKKIEVRLERSKCEALIHVTDSGRGIPQEIQGKIMEPFFTTKPTGQGTGLGLSISRRILREHRGDLYFNNKNKKTSFVIQLPI